MLKPFLSPRDKAVLCVVLPLQVMVNVAVVVVEEEAPGTQGWMTWFGGGGGAGGAGGGGAAGGAGGGGGGGGGGPQARGPARWC